MLRTLPITWPAKNSLLQVSGGSTGGWSTRFAIDSVPFARTAPLSFALPLSAASPATLPFHPKITPVSLAPVSLKRTPLRVPVT